MDMEEEVSEDLQDMEAHLTVDQDLEDQDMAHLQGMGQATDQDQDRDHHHQDTDQGMDHLRREVDLEAQEDLYVVV